MIKCIQIILFLLFTMTSIVGAQSKPDWILGDWQRNTNKGLVIERWSILNDSTWISESVRIQGVDTVLLENVTMHFMESELIYAPTVQGQNGNQEIRFKSVYQTETSLVVENPEHDFPQRIKYWKEGDDSLNAEISGLVGDKEQSVLFKYHRRVETEKESNPTYKNVILATTAFLASGLTFFSGFGLATILTPIMMLFFPVELAIGLTAIVHLLNNLFKLFLVGKHVNKSVLLRFGIPAVIAAFIGSSILVAIPDSNSFYSYSLFNREVYLYPVKSLVATLILLFALMDIIPKIKRLEFDANKLPIGGFLSGFFGGLSGNQGALRTAFLIKAGLSKEAFIATGVMIACFIDLTRISVYAQSLPIHELMNDGTTALLTTIGAISGAWIGNLVLKKITIAFVQTFVAICLIGLSVGLLTGLV